MGFEILFRPLGPARDAQASPSRRPWYRAAPVTLGYVVLVLAVFCIIWLKGGNEGVDQIDAMLGTDVGVLDGEWWKLLTAAWLHVDLDHLVGNCACILIAGAVLECVIGGGAMVGLVLVTMVASSVTYLPFAAGPAVGASGVLCGVYGALLAHPLERFRSPVLSLRTWAPLLVLADLQGTFVPNDHVAVSAHVGGLIAGAMYGAALRPRWEPGPRWRFGSRVAMAGIASLALVGVLSMDEGWATRWHAGAAARADRFGDTRIAAQHARFVVDHAIHVLQPRGLGMAVTFLLAAGDSTKALEAMNGGYLLFGGDKAHYHALMGTMRSRLNPGEEYEANLDFHDALDVNPSSPYALDALARFWISARDTLWRAPKHAVGLAKSAVIEDGGKTPEYMETLAQAYFMTGNRRQAVYWMRRLLKLELDEDVRAGYERTLREMERALVREGGPITLVVGRS